MSRPTAIALHIACLLRKLGTGKPLGPHVQGILREFHKSLRQFTETQPQNTVE